MQTFLNSFDLLFKLNLNSLVIKLRTTLIWLLKVIKIKMNKFRKRFETSKNYCILRMELQRLNFIMKKKLK